MCVMWQASRSSISCCASSVPWRRRQARCAFVFCELLKHTTTAGGDYRLMYYRDADKFEVDLVIENAAGQLVGVEVKAAATVREGDLRGLKKLAGLAGSQFKMGVLSETPICLTDATVTGRRLVASMLECPADRVVHARRRYGLAARRRTRAAGKNSAAMRAGTAG